MYANDRNVVKKRDQQRTREIDATKKNSPQTKHSCRNGGQLPFGFRHHKTREQMEMDQRDKQVNRKKPDC